MPEEAFKLFYVYFGKDVKPPVGHKATVADKTMEMRVKVDEISESLDRDHSPWHGFFFIQCLTEELLKRLKGALAELPQKLPIESKIGLIRVMLVLATLRFFRECVSWRG